MKNRFIYPFIAFCIVCLSNNSNIYAQEKLTCIGANVYNNFRALSNTEVELAMKNQIQCLNIFQSGISNRATGNAFFISGLIITPISLLIVIDDGDYLPEEFLSASPVLFLIGNAVIAGGIIYKIVGKNKIRKSVEMYNSTENLDTSYKNLPDRYNLTFGLRPNGLGLTLCF